MSQTIDQKVVELRFDNSQFEKAIGDTQKTLKEFKSDLDFDKDSSKFGKLGEAADTVKVKFSALEVIAVTAISNITNKAVNAAERIVKSLSIDNISAGWQKYADKTTAVQTIMSATASDFQQAFDDYKNAETEAARNDILQKHAERTAQSVDEIRESFELYRTEGSKALDVTTEQMEYVNEQIEKLNWFTDETSYNLIDMTSNIGKFTAAGVDLPKAVDAMQGIATWAALSGANTEQASRAMYNLAQAMGTGAVKVQDWMSIENANMATKEFKEMAIDTARELGTLMVDNDGITFAPDTKKGTDVTAENFRSTLAEGWFTADVLNAVLERYGKFATNLSDLSSSLLEGEYMTTSTLIKYIEKYRDASDDLAKNEILSTFAEKTGQSVEELRKQFEELSNDELGLKAFKAAQEAKTYQEAINSVKDAVSTGWMNTFEKLFGTYDKAKVLWTDLANDLWDIFASGAEERNEILDKWANPKKNILKIYADDTEQAVEDIEKYFKAYERAEDDLTKENVLSEYAKDTGQSVDEAREAFEQYANAVSGQDHLHDIIIGFTTLIKDLKEAWAEAWSVFDKSDPTDKANKLLSFTERIRDFIQGLALYTRDEEGEIVGLTEKGEKVVAVFTTFIKVIKTVGKILTTAFKVAWKVVKKVWSVLKILFDGITEFFKGFKALFDIKNLYNSKFAATLEATGKQVQKPLSLFDKVAAKLKEWASKFDKAKFFKSMRVWGYKVAKFLDKAWDVIKKIPGKINGLFTKLFGIGIPEAIHKLWDSIKAFFKWLQESNVLKNVWDGIKNFFTWIWNGLKKLLKVENFGQLVDKIKGVFEKVIGFIASLFQGKKKGKGATDTDDIVKLAESDDNYLSAGPIARSMEPIAAGAEANEKSIEKNTSIIASIFKAIGNVIRALFESVGGFLGAIDWSKIFSTIGTIISSLFEAITELIKKIDFNTLLVGLGGVVGILRSIAKLKMAAAIRDFAKSVKWMADAVEQFAIAQKMKAVASIILSIALVVAVIAGAIYVLGALMTPEQLMRGALVLGGFILALFVMMMIMIKVVQKNDTSKLADVGDTTKKVTGLMASVAAFMLSMSILIKRLVQSVVLLSKIDDPSKMWQAVAVVSILMLLCIGLSIAILAFMSKLENSKTKKLTDQEKSFSKKNNKSGSVILALAAFLLMFSFAIKILVSSIVKLSEIKDPNSLTRGAIIIGALMAIVLALAIVTMALTKKLENSKTKDTKNTSKTSQAVLAIAALMLAFSIAIQILVKALVTVSKIKGDNLGAAAAIVIGLMALLIVFSIVILAVASKLQKTSKASSSSSSQATGAILAVSLLLVAVAAAVKILVKSIAMIALAIKAMGAGAVWQGFAVVGILLVALAAVSAILMKVADSVKKPSNMYPLILFVFALTIAIKSIVGAVVVMAILLSTLGPGKVWQAVAAVGAIILALGVIAALMLGLSKAADFKSILAVSVAMLALSISLKVLLPVIKELGEMPLGKVLKAALAILLVLAAFAIGGKLAEAASTGLLALSVLLLSFGAALFLVAEAVKIGALYLELLGKAIVVFSAILVANKTIIVKAAEVLADSVLGALRTLAAGLGGVVYIALEALLKTLDDIFEALYKMATMLMKLVKKLIKPLMDMIVTVVIEVLKGLKEVAPVFFDYIKDLLIRICKLLLDVIPYVNEVLVEFLVSLLEALAKRAYRIGTALIQFLTGLINAIADNIADLITAIVTFLGKVFANLALNAAKIVGDFVDMLVAFIKAAADKVDDLVSSLVDFIAALFKSLTDNVKRVVTPIKDFVEELIIQLGEAIGDIITTLTDVVGKFFDKLGENIPKFIAKVKSFIKKLLNAIGDFWIDIINTISVVVGKFFTAMGDNVSKIIGILKNFVKKLLTAIGDAFVDIIETIATVVSKFFDTLGSNVGKILTSVLNFFGDLLDAVSTGLDDNVFKPVGNIISGLIDTAVGAPVRSAFTAVGSGLSAFATSAKDFFDMLEGVDPEVLSSLHNITDFILAVTANSVVDALKKVATLGFGKTSWETVSLGLTKIAKSMTAFNNELLGNGLVTTENVTILSSYLNMIKDFFSEFRYISTEKQNMQDMMEKLENMGLQIRDMINGSGVPERMKNIGESLAIDLMSAFFDEFYLTQYELSNMASGKELDWYDNLIYEGLDKEIGFSSFEKLLDAISDYFTKSTSDGNKKLKKAGKDAATLLLSAFGQKLYNAQTGLDQNVNNQLILLTSKVYDSFVAAFKTDTNTKKLLLLGYWLVKGLVDGIEDVIHLAEQAGVDTWDGFVSYIKIYSETASPSKAMYRIGTYWVQGLVNGIRENANLAEDSGESLADTTIDGFQKALLTASDYVTDSMYDPLTLTPVLDLSEIQNGTSQLSQMMSSVDGYQLNGSARFASDAYFSRNPHESSAQNASVDRLTNAIEDMIQNPQNNFANTFNINGTNAHEIAEEVSRILQNQMTRRQAVWGL